MRQETACVAGVILAAGQGSRMGGRTKQLLPLDGLPLLAHAVNAAEASLLADIVVILGYQAAAITQALPPLQRARLVENARYAEGQSTSLQTGLAALDDTVNAAVILLGDQPHVRAEVINAIVEAYMQRLPLFDEAHTPRDAPARPDDPYMPRDASRHDDDPHTMEPNSAGLDKPRSTGANPADHQQRKDRDHSMATRPLVIIPTYGGRDGHPVLLDRALWPAVMAIRGDEGARSVVRANTLATLRLPVTPQGTPPDDIDTPEDYATLGSR